MLVSSFEASSDKGIRTCRFLPFLTFSKKVIDLSIEKC
jgi:hypothetical protein